MDICISKRQTLNLDIYPKTPQKHEKIANIPYSSAIDNLMYTMIYLRPDICYVVGLVSRYQCNLKQKH